MIRELCSKAIPLPAKAIIHDASQIEKTLRAWRKKIVTFLGFGELGYQDEGEFQSIVRDELLRHGPAEVIVNTGTLITQGFHRGIADVYPLAKKLGFMTTGIHPSVALVHPKKHYLSGYVEHVFFVKDETWGGYLEDVRRSPTLETLIAVTDEVVVIGGGKHTAQEMLEFLQGGKPLRFYPADMNHRVAADWFCRQGESPVDFRGAAYHAWIRSHRQRAV